MPISNTRPSITFLENNNCVAYRSTRFTIRQCDYDMLIQNEACTHLYIQVNRGTGNHPYGRYLIPRVEAIDFIEGKMGTPNWDRHQDFKQDAIPIGLENFFEQRDI